MDFLDVFELLGPGAGDDDADPARLLLREGFSSVLEDSVWNGKNTSINGATKTIKSEKKIRAVIFT